MPTMYNVGISKVLTALAVLLPGTASALGASWRTSSQLDAKTGLPGIHVPDTPLRSTTISDAVVQDEDGGILARGRSLLHGCHYARYATP